MDRSEAARLLGVPEHADPVLIRRAYRTWARIAHPDVGGDPEHFARLAHARRTLMRRDPAVHQPMPAAPPRPPLSAMIQRPSHGARLVAGAILSIATVTLTLLGAPPVVTALIAGTAAASWSWIATRACLRSGADAGHRIAMLALTWLPVAVAQVTLATMLHTGLIETLPLLTLPFAAAIASVNAGAGLWRPVR